MRNKANVSSSLNGYLIDLSVHKKPKNDYHLKKSLAKMSRNEACSGFISSVNNQGLVKITFNDIISQ